MYHQRRLIDEELLEMARHHAYGSLGLHPDPELAFAGCGHCGSLPTFVRATRFAGYARLGTVGRGSPPGPALAAGGPQDIAVATRAFRALSRWHARHSDQVVGRARDRGQSRPSVHRACPTDPAVPTPERSGRPKRAKRLGWAGHRWAGPGLRRPLPVGLGPEAALLEGGHNPVPVRRVTGL
jgi:hypothetical protein